MPRQLQSASSHISISISISLLNIHPAFTPGCPRSSVSVFTAPHFCPVPRLEWLCIARSSLLRSGHTGFLSHQSPLRWRLAQRSARDSSIAAVPVQGALHHMTSFLLFRVLFTLSNCTVVYIVSFHGPSLKNVFLTRALTVAHGSLSWA